MRYNHETALHEIYCPHREGILAKFLHLGGDNFHLGATSPKCKKIGIDTTPPRYSYSYLLGLLAKIKCSICSYQCDN